MKLFRDALMWQIKEQTGPETACYFHSEKGEEVSPGLLLALKRHA